MAHIQPCNVQQHPSSSSPPPPILEVAGKRVCETATHPVHKTLATAANLANLLPTGTLLAFRTLTPPFSNKGTCQLANVQDQEYFAKYKIGAIDFLHAIVSVLVFLIFALSDSDVERCFFPEAGENMRVLMMNLPMAVGFFSSTLFVLFPTTRRGSGYTDLPC